MTTTIIKEFICRSRRFTIVKQDGWYCAIEDKYIDPDGKLNTTLNGMQMHADRDLSTCLNRVRDLVEIDYLVTTGMTKAEAFAHHFGLMEKLAEIESMMA